MENQTSALAIVGNHLQQFGLSLLASRDEKVIEGRISAINNNLVFESQCLRATDDPAEKTVIKANIIYLQNERRDQTQRLAKASNVTLQLIGPAPGTIIARPPAQTFSQLSLAPSSLPDAPAIAPTFIQNPPTTPAPAPDLPNCPESTALDKSFAVSPISLSPIKFIFTPNAKIPVKCSKPVHPMDTPAKRLKPAERNSITRSASKTSLLTQTQTGDETELFREDADMTVCSPSLILLPCLFTACADQGQCFTIGSMPLDVGVPDNTLELKRIDQSGRACSAESLSRKSMYTFHTSKSLPTFVLWTIVTIILFSLVHCAAATATPAGSLSLFALNTNGFVHPMKIDATNRAISHRNPDIVVITETKTNSSGSSKMSYTDYQFFEERGTPTIGHHLFKWGVILGVKKGITVSQRVPIDHPALAGRLVAVDIVIPLDTGQGFTHRIFAVYAPWDVGDNADTAAFWHEASKLCLNMPSLWTLLGDLNATVSHAERKSGGSDARAHFNNFL
jgi:hypothetical protein